MSENFTPWDSIQSESDRKLVKLRAEVADLRAEIERLRGALSAAADFHNTEVAELRAEIEWLRKHTDPTDLLPLRPPKHGYPIPD
jgi:uncharacterized membrane protein YccC